jgi:hypothetical protein
MLTHYAIFEPPITLSLNPLLKLGNSLLDFLDLLKFGSNAHGLLAILSSY